MKESVKGFVNDHPTLVLLKRAAKEWMDDEAPTMSAALAYYALLSLAPLIVIAIMVAALVYGPQAANGELSGMLGGVLGEEAAQTIEDMVSAASERMGTGITATALGLVALLFAASNVFAQLQKFMNKAWDVEAEPGNWKDKIMDRVAAFGTVLLVGVLLLASIAATALLGAFGPALLANVPGGALVWQVVQFAVTVIVVTGLFAFLYRYLPDARVSWKDVTTGALITGILFAIGQLALSAYLARSATANMYGAAGSLIVILLWAYYSGMIFFFGAELTQVYANTRGDGIRPEEGARAREGEHPGARDRPSDPGRGAGGAE